PSIFWLLVAFATSHLRRVDALKQHRELARVDLHLRYPLSGLHAAEGASLQLLHQHAKTVAIPEQDAHLRAATVEEDKQVAAHRGQPERALYQRAQTSKALTQVRRLRRQVQLHARW